MCLSNSRYLILIVFLFFFNHTYSQNDVSTESLRIEYQKAKNDTTRIRTLFKLGYQFLNGPSDSLIHYFRKSLSIADKNLSLLYQSKIENNAELIKKYHRLSIRALIEIGIEYFYQSDYPKALDYFTDALELSIEIDDQSLASECYSEIGIVFKNQGKYNEALKYAEQGTDSSWIAACLVNTWYNLF